MILSTIQQCLKPIIEIIMEPIVLCGFAGGYYKARGKKMDRLHAALEGVSAMFLCYISQPAILKYIDPSMYMLAGFVVGAYGIWIIKTGLQIAIEYVRKVLGLNDTA